MRDDVSAPNALRSPAAPPGAGEACPFSPHRGEPGPAPAEPRAPIADAAPMPDELLAAFAFNTPLLA